MFWHSKVTWNMAFETPLPWKYMVDVLVFIYFNIVDCYQASFFLIIVKLKFYISTEFQGTNDRTEITTFAPGGQKIRGIINFIRITS